MPALVPFHVAELPLGEIVHTYAVGIAFIAIAGLLPLIVLRPRRPQSDFLARRAAELNPGILEDVSRRREL